MPPQPESAAHDLVDASVQLIASLQHPSGAYPASPTFSAYRGYCWLRDGSFIADAMSAAGEHESADRFFDWCATVVTRQRQSIETAVTARADGGEIDIATMPPTRFTLEGQIGADDWWDFQTDGYGTWLWALSEHVRRGGTMDERWLPAIDLTVRFLVATWDMPCYDWWEESPEERHVSTLGCVVLGLERAVAHDWLPAELVRDATAAAQAARALVRADGVRDGHLVKWIGSAEVDSSLAAVVAMGYLDDEPDVALATVGAVRQQLLVADGVYRYLRDVFYGGGRWPLLTCFLGWAELRLGEPQHVSARLAFAASAADDVGHLPEQVPDHLLAPDHRQEWLDRWGPVAQPLLWSHAMYVRLAAEENIA